MNPFLLSHDERLAHWKEFRRSLGAMDEIAQLRAVADYWSKAPLKSIAYDPADASNWPTPWEMMHANEWCRSSVAIMMEATLRLAGFSPDRMLLKLIIDRDIQEELLVLIIDAQWVLNYDWGFIQPYPKTDHSAIRAWRFAGKTYSLLNG